MTIDRKAVEARIAELRENCVKDLRPEVAALAKAMGVPNDFGWLDEERAKIASTADMLEGLLREVNRLRPPTPRRWAGPIGERCRTCGGKFEEHIGNTDDCPEPRIAK